VHSTDSGEKLCTNGVEIRGREERRGLWRVPTRGVEAVLGVRERKWERGVGGFVPREREEGGTVGEEITDGWAPSVRGRKERAAGIVGWLGTARSILIRVGPVRLVSFFLFFFLFFFVFLFSPLSFEKVQFK
jgi:hypothetical protein